MNPSLTDLYLAELELLLPPGRRRSRFLRELRDHITDAAEERIEHGVPPLDAESDAIAKIGAPDLIADEAAPELRAGNGFMTLVARLLRRVAPAPRLAIASGLVTRAST